jgi:hypothetical protein
VPFFANGHCAAIRAADGFRLPSGDVAPGEDYLLDAALRIPLETAGFRRQTFHAFARTGTHVFAWCEGARYRGSRSHAAVPLEMAIACRAPKRAANSRSNDARTGPQESWPDRRT